MRLDNFLISILLFSLFIVVGVLIQTDVISEYDVNQTTDRFTDVYRTSDDMYNLGQNMKNDTFESDIEGTDQSWESMTKGSYSAVRFIRDSFTIVGDIMDAIAKSIGIPVIFVTFTMIILTTLIVFAIIYLVFRFIPK